MCPALSLTATGGLYYRDYPLSIKECNIKKMYSFLVNENGNYVLPCKHSNHKGFVFKQNGMWKCKINDIWGKKKFTSEYAAINAAMEYLKRIDFSFIYHGNYQREVLSLNNALNEFTKKYFR